MRNYEFLVSCKIDIPVQFSVENEQNRDVLEKIAEDIALGQIPINAKCEVLNIESKN